jgi:hypothetical protein
MNYIQFYHQVFPVKIVQEDKANYIAALIESRKKEDNAPFREFMAQQLLKMLKEETTTYKQSQNKGFSLMF